MTNPSTLKLANEALQSRDLKTAVILYERALSNAAEPLRSQIQFNLELANSRMGAQLESQHEIAPVLAMDFVSEGSIDHRPVMSRVSPRVIEETSESPVFESDSESVVMDVEKLRIVFCTHDLKLQGAPKSLFEVIAGLYDRGAIEPIVLSPYDGPLREQYVERGISVVVIEGGNIWNCKTAERYHRAVALFKDAFLSLQPAAVFANTFTMFHAAYAAQKVAIPVILNPRESEPPKTFFDEFPAEIQSKAYQTISTVNRVIFVANATRKQWEFANQNNTFAVIHNALPEESLAQGSKQTSTRNTARSHFGIADRETVFACVGTVTTRKGQLDIVKAFATLPEAIVLNSRLLILGISENAYSRDVQKMVEAMSPSFRSRVQLFQETAALAEHSLVRSVYSAADVFVLSSRIESYPRVILEAMSYGLPIITTPCFGVVEQVRNDIEALYYSEGDTDELAKHMTSLVKSPERRLELADAVNIRAVELDSYDDMISAYEKNLFDVIGETSLLKVLSPVNNSTLVPYSQDTMRLSVCIVSRKSDNVERLLTSLETAGLPKECEVLVSWNGEGSPVFRSVIPDLKVHVIDNRPYNFAKNNNVISRFATGDFLLFVNDDVMLDVDSVRLMISESELHNDAMVGPNLRYPTDQLQHAGVFFNDRWEPFHRYKHALHYQHLAVSENCDVPAISGACILMKRRDFDAIGGFNEQYRTAGEDINLCVQFRQMLGKAIRYCAQASGIHVENATRRETGDRVTPPEDLSLIRKCAARLLSSDTLPGDGVRLSIHTEKPGWIMHRKAVEIQKLMKNTTINEDVLDADIHYYINYGYYFRSKTHAKRRGLKVANFTHFDPGSLADQFREAAQIMDHCVSVSGETTKILLDLGVPKDKITTILVGADVSLEPMLTLGLVGRVYQGGRKGEHLIKELLADRELMTGVRIVANNEDWGVPVWRFDDQADFYRSIDYLLVPALIEGGPVPFMEALACGTLSIAPPIGVVPQFRHISYQTGDIASLKKAIHEVKSNFLLSKRSTASAMAGIDWLTWALKHQELFQRLVMGKGYTQML